MELPYDSVDVTMATAQATHASDSALWMIVVGTHADDAIGAAIRHESVVAAMTMAGGGDLGHGIK